MQFFDMLNKSNGLKVLLILVVLDSIFGVLRALRQKKFNSNIGIDGLIRKFGMLISVVFFMLIDLIEAVNFIGFIPEEARSILGIETVGVSTMFIILYIIYESLSILKNMIKCKLPIPKKFQKFLETIFIKYTKELEEEKEK